MDGQLCLLLKKIVGSLGLNLQLMFLEIATSWSSTPIVAMTYTSSLP